jgi:hypothetical protein
MSKSIEKYTSDISKSISKMYTTPRSTTEITPSKTTTTKKTTTDETTKRTTEKTTTDETRTGLPFPSLLGGGGPERDKRRRFKKHEEVFEYKFDPWTAARITAKELKAGSNLIRNMGSSLPKSMGTPIAVATPKQRVVSPKPVQRTPQLTMPRINAPRSATTLKSLSLPSSMPTQRKKVRK